MSTRIIAYFVVYIVAIPIFKIFRQTFFLSEEKRLIPFTLRKKCFHGKRAKLKEIFSRNLSKKYVLQQPEI